MQVEHYSRRDIVKLLTPGGWLPEAIKGRSLSGLSNVAKRSLAKDILLLNPASILAACTPQKESAMFVAEDCKRLGEEVENWTLASGVKMAERFPEVQRAADVLLGKVDPRVYFPFLAVPVNCLGETRTGQSGEFHVKIDSDATDPRHIKVTSPTQEFRLTMLKKNLPASINLSKDARNSSIRLPIAVKEASQLVDNVDYSKVYVLLLEESGARFSLENPKSISTTEEEFITTIAFAQMSLELGRTGRSWFLEFVDWGSHIRVGGIAFANWYFDMYQKGVTPTEKTVEQGLNVAGFLQTKGLIQQEKDGFVWTQGQPPAIRSRGFLELFNELTGRKLPVFP